MIVVKEAKRWIANGATFAIMRSKRGKRNDIYWLKFAGRDGFEIPLRTGRYLEKNKHTPVEWPYDP